ncbi:MAG: branched-chain amino acid ABC transporter permease, partial [Pannonibacter indicus]
MRKPILALLLIVFLAAIPTLTAEFGQASLLALATRILIYGMAAASLNFVLGYGGMVSFGHAAFFGIGAYVVGILATHHSSGEPLFGFIPGTDQMLITLPLAVLVAGFFAAVIGSLSLRTGGVQFIMITLAFAQMLFFLFVSLKAYGGEAREDLRLATVVSKWSLRTRRAWIRGTWSGTGQNIVLLVLRAAV